MRHNVRNILTDLAKKSLTVAMLVIGFAALGQRHLKVYESAEKLFYQDDPINAIVKYKEVLEIKPNFKDSEYKIEICSLLVYDTGDDPLDRLMELHNKQAKGDKFFNYFLGRIYLNRYMFEESIFSFESFLGSRASKSEIIVEETHFLMDEAKRYLAFFDNTDNYEIRHLGGEINTEAAELTPAYFTEKEELLFASARNSSSKESFKIYHAVKQDDGWTKLSAVDILGQFGRETANIEVVDEDGKLFLFNKKGGGSLYYSETNNGKWVQPVIFDAKLNSAHIKSHFFINEHEDRIIFASDKEAKTKGLDIYQTYLDPNSGKWSKPAPFASVINSDFDEDSPYLTHDEKTMYFSSKGHGAIGGYDVYISKFDDETSSWSAPVNMGFPINSPDDEIHFKINPDNKSGYFSSNRLHSRGDFDIYFFWEIEKINIEGRVFDGKTKEAISDATVRFTPSSYTDEHFRSETSASGKYETEIVSEETYLIEVIKEGQTIFTDNFEIHATGGQATRYIKNIVLNGPQEDLQVIGGPSETAVAAAGTSAVSTPPTPPTDQPESGPIEDPVEEPKPQLAVSGSGMSSPPPVAEGKQRITKPSDTDTQNLRNLGSYEVGGKIILRNIYFDFGTSGLSRNASTVLNELYAALDANPDVRVEISGHTDNIGSSAANKWISENRAKTVMKWLVNEGISPDRLEAKGYGETQPLASNDDEINGRELNRRIEVRIIN